MDTPSFALITVFSNIFASFDFSFLTWWYLLSGLHIITWVNATVNMNSTVDMIILLVVCLEYDFCCTFLMLTALGFMHAKLVQLLTVWQDTSQQNISDLHICCIDSASYFSIKKSGFVVSQPFDEDSVNTISLSTLQIVGLYFVVQDCSSFILRLRFR